MFDPSASIPGSAPINHYEWRIREVSYEGAKEIVLDERSWQTYPYDPMLTTRYSYRYGGKIYDDYGAFVDFWYWLAPLRVQLSVVDEAGVRGYAEATVYFRNQQILGHEEPPQSCTNSQRPDRPRLRARAGVRRGYGPRGRSRAGASMPTRRAPVWRHGRGVGGLGREPGPRPAGRGGWEPSIAHRPHHQEGPLLRPARRGSPRQPSPERARTVAPAQQTPAPRAADLYAARPPGQAEEQDPSDFCTPPDQKEPLMRTRTLVVVTWPCRHSSCLSQSGSQSSGRRRAPLTRRSSWRSSRAV